MMQCTHTHNVLMLQYHSLFMQSVEINIVCYIPLNELFKINSRYIKKVKLVASLM